jgi:hypothetical protein
VVCAATATFAAPEDDTMSSMSCKQCGRMVILCLCATLTSPHVLPHHDNPEAIRPSVGVIHHPVRHFPHIPDIDFDSRPVLASRYAVSGTAALRGGLSGSGSGLMPLSGQTIGEILGVSNPPGTYLGTATTTTSGTTSS